MRQKFFILSLALFSFLSFIPLQAEDGIKEEIQKDLKKYGFKIPGIGLVVDKIRLEGVELSNFRFETNNKYVVCLPGQEVVAAVDYKVDANDVPGLPPTNIIVGLWPGGPQQVILASWGILDTQGTSEFTLTAPLEKGIYQIRFCCAESFTDSHAKEAWFRPGNPPAKTLMGVLVVQ